MSDINDEHTYCCDQCGVPVVLSNLIPVGKEHWCRFCVDRESAQSERAITSADLKAFARFPEGSPVVEGPRLPPVFCSHCGKVKYNAAARCVSTACNP